MLFRVIDGFKRRDSEPIYARLREHGRATPDGPRPVESWIGVRYFGPPHRVDFA